MPAIQQGSISQLPSGRWSARYRDEHGVQRRVSTFKTEREATRWLDKRLEVETLSVEEIERIDENLPRRLRGLAVFAFETGLRPEELVALRHGDLDRKTGVVRIRRVFTAADGMRDGTAKTRKSIRSVPL